MEKINGFFTMKGYQINEDIGLTTAMEDYLEMICRILRKERTVRVRDLSNMLHVKPSSTSKMIQQLKDRGYLHAQKYGMITLTEAGEEAGQYLLYRHDVLQKFLCLLNDSEDELEQVEKIEHFLNKKTIENLDVLIKNMQNKGDNGARKNL